MDEKPTTPPQRRLAGWSTTGEQRPKVLVTGATGQVGRELVSLGALGLTRSDLDLDAPQSVLRDAALRLFEGSATVIGAAAFTDVDGAEDPARRSRVERINAVAPGILAAAAAEVGATFLQLSTDYVFSGTPPQEGREWTVGDAVDPAVALNWYGRTKALGEEAARVAGATVVRTAWVWSGPDAPGRDFVTTMADLALRGTDPSVVSDQVGRPTYAPDLAAGLWEFSQNSHRPAQSGQILHFTNSGEPVSWCGFAQEIFRALGQDPGRVTACPSSAWPSPARRPPWSVLDLTSWRHAVGEPAPWTDALRRGLTGTVRTVS